VCLLFDRKANSNCSEVFGKTVELPDTGDAHELEDARWF
jgi:hypothetical protein